MMEKDQATVLSDGELADKIRGQLEILNELIAKAALRSIKVGLSTEHYKVGGLCLKSPKITATIHKKI